MGRIEIMERRYIPATPMNSALQPVAQDFYLDHEVI